METSETTKIADIRQSPHWGKYLSWLGWRSYVTKRGINIEITPTKLGSFVKIQRPAAFSKEDLDEIEDICIKNRALFIKIEPYIDQDISVLENSGYRISLTPLAPPSTIYLNLSLDRETLWWNISKSGRYSIRHSEAKTKFYKNPSEDLLKKFYLITSETSKMQKFMIQSFDDLKKKVEIFGDESFLALGYDHRGELTGGKFFLGYKDAIWYVHAGTNKEGRKSDSGHKMMWEAMLHFKELGYKTMDMDGIDDNRFPMFTKNWGGFSFFKEKFGGQVVRFPYPRIKYFNKVFRFLNKLKALPL
jgi:lipid II:glycine glycyltransferase (peptidoglycan interpeptide bridge formation enzyme)